MDFGLTSEQELIRSSAREFAERELAPHTRDWDRAEAIDRSLVPKLAAAGYLGAGWDEDYGGSGLDVVSYALVPTDADGFESHPIKGKLGLRAQDTAELSLDAVRVPDENRLGELDGGFRIAMSALDVGRISLAAGCVGIAQGCLDASIAYARERRAFGRPIAGFQLVQELIADIAVETEAARLLAWRAAALAGAKAEHTLESP